MQIKTIFSTPSYPSNDLYKPIESHPALCDQGNYPSHTTETLSLDSIGFHSHFFWKKHLLLSGKLT